MPYRKNTNLTLGMIADAWSQEIANAEAANTGDTVHADRNNILHRLLGALWQGEFESAGKSLLTIHLPHYTAYEHRDDSDLSGGDMVTRRGLVRVLELKGFLPPLPKLNDSTGETVFDALSKLAPNEFGNLPRISYLEALIISRDGFGTWCDTQGFERPSFWFDADSSLDQTARQEDNNNHGH